MDWDIELVHIFVSDGHNFVGRHGKGSLGHEARDLEEIECVAGRGIRGDRFFDHKEDYKGQITFFEYEVYEQVKEEFGIPALPASAFRRNVLTKGAPLQELIGKSFSIRGVEFSGIEEAAPCYWMNEACAEGVHDYLKGKGGLRARITKGGELKRGSSSLTLLP